MDCNRETILDGLHDFEKRSNNISPVLEEYLLKVAKTGDTMFPWIKLKPLLKRKLELVLTEFQENSSTDDIPPSPNVEVFKFDVHKTKLLDALESFQSAPFTIQRMCELLTDPQKHYKRADKFMRGLEKNVLVVSTIEPKSSLEIDVNCNSPSMLVNGLINVPEELQSSGIIPENDNLSEDISESLKMSNCHTPLDNFASAFASAPSILTTEVTDLIEEKYINAHCSEECDVIMSVSTSHLTGNTMDTSPDSSEINDESSYSSEHHNRSPVEVNNYIETECRAEYVCHSTDEASPIEVSIPHQDLLGSPESSEYVAENCVLTDDKNDETYIHESNIDDCDEETSEATENCDEEHYEVDSSKVEESEVMPTNASILLHNELLNQNNGELPDLFVSSQILEEEARNTLTIASDIVKVCCSTLNEEVATEIVQNYKYEVDSSEIETEIMDQDLN